MFLDVHVYVEYDAGHSIEEDRYNAIGNVGKLIFAVFTIRGTRTRIISARKANFSERRKYYDSFVRTE